MSSVAELIARQILEIDKRLDPHSPNYPVLRRSLYPWWWSLEPRYAVPPYTKVEVPDMPPRPRVFRQLVWKAYLKMKKKLKTSPKLT